MSNRGALPMTEDELVYLLTAAMEGIDAGRCEDPECEAHQRLYRVWWDTYNRLLPTTQETMAIASMTMALPFPPIPEGGMIL